jgi:hypothetical protein
MNSIAQGTSSQSPKACTQKSPCKTFYVTPKKPNPLDFPHDYGKTYVCHIVPNNAVCTSEPEFRFLLEHDAELQVYKKQPAVHHTAGFSGWTLIEVGVTGLVAGALAVLVTKH